MRLKLRVNRENKDAVEQELLAFGIEISEDAHFILTEENYQEEKLCCRDGADRVVVPFAEICHIESLGHDVFVYTMNQKYKIGLRLYQLESMLPSDQFIRISNSVIICRNSIRRIRPALSAKFILTLNNGAVVDVTRTYFYKFKEFYGI